MRFKIKCKGCEATAWVSGADDPETNSVELKDDNPEWDCKCPDLDYDIVDYEEDDIYD